MFIVNEDADIIFFPYCKSKGFSFIQSISYHMNVLLFADALDNLDERVKNFFKKCTQPNMKVEWKDEQFKLIKQVTFTLHRTDYIT
jgi:hypothetical protein